MWGFFNPLLVEPYSTPETAWQISKNIPSSTGQTGPAVADDIKGVAKVYLAPDTRDATETALIAAFKKEAALYLKTHTGSSLEPGGSEQQWFTGESDRNITDDDIKKLANGSEIIYLLASENYTDPTGPHYMHYCRSVQPPAFNPEVWHFCNGYQDHQ